MIKDTDDKKIIFNNNKKFNTNNYEIRNKINNREIQINDETILHACITDITFEDDKVIINFLSKDDLEFTYEISKEAETGEIPAYLQINETDIVQLAIKIFVLEAYKVFMSDTTLPEANAINELQGLLAESEETITELTSQVEDLTEQLDAAYPPDNWLMLDFGVNLDNITFDTAFSGGVSGASNEYLSGGTVKVLIPTDNLTGFDASNSASRAPIVSAIPITNLIINDVEVNITGQTNTSSGNDIAVTLSFSISPASEHPVSALENNTISVDIHNNNTGYVRTMEGTFTIDGTTIGSITTLNSNGGGGN